MNDVIVDTLNDLRQGMAERDAKIKRLTAELDSRTRDAESCRGFQAKQQATIDCLTRKLAEAESGPVDAGVRE